MLDLTKKPYCLTASQIESVEKQVAEMTTAAKICQLFFVMAPGGRHEEQTAFIHRYQPGGVMFRPAAAAELTPAIQNLQDASALPLFVAANLESGGNGLLEEGTFVSTPLGVAATRDPHHAYQLGEIGGREARSVGANMAFAPIVDIDFNFRNPIMNTRTFGDNVDRVRQMSLEEARGFDAADVIPVIKHFPGDGVDERDQHLLASVNHLSAADWDATYGSVYKAHIAAGISTIMIGHIFQPACERQLCPDLRDDELRPASTSKRLVDGLLRGKLGFNGLTITDATPMLGYNVTARREELLPETINAGVDMILFNRNIDEDYAIVTAAVEDGTIPMARLNEAVTRILATKMAQHVQAQAVGETSTAKNDERHADVASAIADQAITLVKDRDGLLPLSPKRTPRVRLTVLGDGDDGGFKQGGRVGARFAEKLRQAGFTVTVFNQKQLDMKEVFTAGVQDLKKKFDLSLYVANVETASNQTTTRIDWVHLMAADAPWYLRDIPTVFISTANPYHLFDVPMISTYINAYTGNEATLTQLMAKLLGQSSFKGMSPVDPFCGDFTAHL